MSNLRGTINVLGNLVFTEKNNLSRWLDAIGPNVIKYITHFISLPTDDTTGDPTEFTTTLVEAGAGESTAVLGTDEGGVLLLTTDANENDGVQLQLKGEAFTFGTNKVTNFSTRLQISDVTQSDFLVGLCITDTTLLGGLSDGVYFRKVDGSASVSFVTEKNSTETTTAVLTMVADTWYTFTFHYDGTATTPLLKAWVTTGTTESAEFTLAITNLPDDEVLTPSIAFLTGEAAAKTMKVDFLRAIEVF